MISIEVKINGIIVGQIAGPKFNSRSPDDPFQILTRTGRADELAALMGTTQTINLWAMVGNIIHHASLAAPDRPAIEMDATTHQLEGSPNADD